MNKAACVKRSGLWSIPARTMTLACLLVFMAQMATTVYLPSLPTVMRELAMSRRATELSISIFVIGAALPVLFWGRLPIALPPSAADAFPAAFHWLQRAVGAVQQRHPAAGAARCRV